MVYSSGNYDKYMTNNPLKRAMVKKLNNKIIKLVEEDAVKCQRGHSDEWHVRILDAGCGEGFISGLLYSNLKTVEIIGLEYTTEALQMAQRMNPNLTFIQGNIFEMPFESQSFDIVLCTEVLEHLPNPDAALAELLRVTGETLIITVPHEPWFCMGNMLALKNVTRFGNPIDHINHWTFDGFCTFLRDSSQVEWQFDKSFPWTIAHYRKQCTRHREKVYQDLNEKVSSASS